MMVEPMEAGAPALLSRGAVSNLLAEKRVQLVLAVDLLAVLPRVTERELHDARRGGSCVGELPLGIVRKLREMGAEVHLERTRIAQRRPGWEVGAHRRRRSTHDYLRERMGTFQYAATRAAREARQPRKAAWRVRWRCRSIGGMFIVCRAICAMSASSAIRLHVARLLDWEDAHAGFDRAVEGLPAPLRGT